MDKIIDFIKKHPYGVAVGVFIGGLVLIFLFKSGKSSAPATNSSDSGYYAADAAAIQSGNQLQATQIAGQVQAGQTAAQLSAAQSADAAQIQIAQLQAGVSTVDIQSAAQVQMANITATATTQQQANTLAAQVANNNITANLTANTNATNEALASINAQSLLSSEAIAALTSASNGYTINGGSVGPGATIVSPSLSTNNTDPVAAQITQLYAANLGRAPDAQGLKFYENYVAGGGNLAAVATYIQSSPEYVQEHPASGGHPG